MTAYNITGAQAGRITLVSGDTVDVSATGSLSVSANAQAIRMTASADNVAITNDGTIEDTASAGRAIRVENTVTGPLDVVLTNDAGAFIQSQDDAVQVQSGASFAAGSVFAVTNRGTIQSIGGAGVGGQGLDLTGVTGTDVQAQVDNYGTIRGTFNDGVRFGGEGHLHNYGGGVVNGGSDAAYAGNVDGVTFLDDAFGDVVNDANGDISGDRHGINAGLNSTVTVTNNGTITGRNGSGVGSDGSATVINYGTITGAFSDSAGSDTHGHTPGQPDGGGADGVNDGDGDGIDVDFLATIENYGLIQGTGAGGNGSDGLPNTSEGIAAGGGTITNHTGATIRGLGLGILIDDSSQGDAPFVTHIVNDGALEGASSYGVRIVSDLDDTIVNSGTISGGAGVAIQFGSGDNVLSLLAGSSITGLSDGGDGVDTLDYSGLTSGGVSVDLSVGTASLTDGVTGFENVFGGAFADSLTGDAGSNALLGGAGADTLTGLDGNDRYYVDSSDDVVVEQADGGKDAVFASSSYTLSDNVENLYAHDAGGAGLALTGNALNNYIHGGDGADTLTGLDGNDSYYVGAGDVVVEDADGGTDSVYAEASFTLSDNIERLVAHGVAGDSGLALTGNGSDNVIRGGAGGDTIAGGEGRDRLYGNGGHDTFVFDSVSGSNVTHYDRIYDFVSGDDKIDLHAIQAVSGAGTDQPFSWIGDAAYSHAAGELHQRFTGLSTTLIEGDVDGDGHTDFRIAIAGHVNLSANDFIL